MSKREVTKDEFDAFAKAYPRPLERSVTAICEPPQLSYNDFTLGDWPKSVVASVSLEDWRPWEPEGKQHPPTKDAWYRYYIEEVTS